MVLTEDFLKKNGFVLQFSFPEHNEYLLELPQENGDINYLWVDYSIHEDKCIVLYQNLGYSINKKVEQLQEILRQKFNFEKNFVL